MPDSSDSGQVWVCGHIEPCATVGGHIQRLGYPRRRYLAPRWWTPPEACELIEGNPDFTVWEDESGGEVVVRHAR